MIRVITTVFWGFALGFAGPSVAWAQGMGGQPQEPSLLAQTIGNLIAMMIFGGILLLARRNMKGWDQPIKFVWFSFSGRLNRKAYWLKGAVALGLVILVAQTIAMLLGAGAGAVAGPGGAAAVALVIIVPAFILQFWASISMLVKRSHDLGHSGWWALGILVPIWNIWVSIQVMFFRGEVGPNTFGPDPIDPYEDYIADLTGGGGSGGGFGGGEAAPEDDRPRPHPKPPEAAGAAPKGFGSRTFKAPERPAPEQGGEPAEQKPAEPERPLQDKPDMDLIKRRLGPSITLREDD